MICGPKLIRYSATPRGLPIHANFMHDVSMLKSLPASWKDMFWENMWSKDGS